MSKRNPVAFKDLTVEQLQAAADYFVTPYDEDPNKEALIAALVEDEVEWDDYVGSEVPLKPESLIPVAEPVKEETLITSLPEVVTAEAVPVLAQANYLIKMERKNPLFEFGNYRFTHDNPYQIMPAADAQKILEKEQGFRQAFPAELQEYYS